MNKLSMILTGTAGLAAMVAIASPAAAQSYPYNNGNTGGVVGAIINGVTGGYGQYPQGNYGYGQVNERAAVGQCAAAAEQRLNYRQSGYANNGYGNNGYGNNGYQNGYGYNGQMSARVVGITNVERRPKGGLRVTGVATSGRGYANQGYNNGYPGNRYNGGYANQQADLQFTCKVSRRGEVSDININRIQTAYRRGY